MAFSEDIVEASVVPTTQKFCYIAYLLGINATAVYNTVAGLVPPQNYSYGRYYDSGNPLDQYALFSGSLDQLVAQGVSLRQTLYETLQALVQTAAEDDITTALAPAVYGAFAALVNCFASPSDTINAMTILAAFTAPPIPAGNDCGRTGDKLAGGPHSGSYPGCRADQSWDGYGAIQSDQSERCDQSAEHRSRSYRRGNDVGVGLV
jgi:hypothetical protein